MIQRLAFVVPVALGMFGAGMALHGQEPPRGGGPGGPGGPPFLGIAIFSALDADHDNSLTAAEIAASSSALKALDKNGDGKVTADEFPAGRGGPGGRGG